MYACIRVASDFAVLCITHFTTTVTASSVPPGSTEPTMPGRTKQIKSHALAQVRAQERGRAAMSQRGPPHNSNQHTQIRFARRLSVVFVRESSRMCVACMCVCLLKQTGLYHVAEKLFKRLLINCSDSRKGARVCVCVCGRVISVLQCTSSWVSLWRLVPSFVDCDCE